MQDLFYDKMLADDRVNFFFKGVDMKKQRAHQVGHSACLLAVSGNLSTPTSFQGMHGGKQVARRKSSSVSGNSSRGSAMHFPGFAAGMCHCSRKWDVPSLDCSMIAGGVEESSRSVCMLWPLICCIFRAGSLLVLCTGRYTEV